MKHSEYGIQTDPKQCHEHNTVVVFYHDICFAGLDVISFELFLASRALQCVGEEAEYHLNNEHNEDNKYCDLLDVRGFENIYAVNYLVEDIVIEQNKKNDYSDEQPYVMVYADFSNLAFTHARASVYYLSLI